MRTVNDAHIVQNQQNGGCVSAGRHTVTMTVTMTMTMPMTIHTRVVASQHQLLSVLNLKATLNKKQNLLTMTNPIIAITRNYEIIFRTLRVR